jgi:membrane-bound metal-dependent hydrolase YbcI (DUF457 family)
MLLVLLFVTISIADVSLEEVFHLPMRLKHSLHIVALLIIGVLGWRYWRNSAFEKLWLITYGIVTAVVCVNYFFFLMVPPKDYREWKQIIAQLRASFGGPLPLLVFSLFQRLLRK